MTGRIVVVAMILLSGAGVIATASRPEQVPPRQPLANFPMELGNWRGSKEADFTADVLDVLGVDEYINRLYRPKSGYAGLYIGYSRSQRQGDTIHSPLNCLPGAGWEPLSKTYLPIEVRADKDGSGVQTVVVNQYIIQKG